MSVIEGVLPVKIILAAGKPDGRKQNPADLPGGTGKEADETRKDLKTELLKMLSSPLSEPEREQLSEQGYRIAKPTKQTLILAALCKKASSGDLSAYKEIRSIVIGSGTTEPCEGVTIIDDVADSNLRDYRRRL